MYVYNTEVFRFFLFFIGFFSRLNRLESDTEPAFCIETLVPDSCVFVANELAPDSLVSRKYPTKRPFTDNLKLTSLSESVVTDHSSVASMGNLLLQEQRQQQQQQQSAQKMSSPNSSAVLHRNLHEEFPRVVGGEGSYLILSDNRRILDASGGAAVSCIGHGDSRVRQAIVAQLNKVEYATTTFYTTDACEELCRELVNSTDGQMSRAYIVNSGQ